MFHKSPAVCLAALKFFLGQDAPVAAGDADGDSDDDHGAGAAAAGVGMPSKEDYYKANKQVGRRPLAAAPAILAAGSP